jgi:hypothetical protein
VAANADLSPDSLRQYRSSLVQVFDFAEIVPNPAKDRRLKVPTWLRRSPCLPPVRIGS